jgi:antagonist of KipI
VSLLRIAQPGICSTLQDLGRPSFGSLGVPWGGAMDPVSHRLASLLVGNLSDQATIEMTMLGVGIEFTEETLVAFAGADFSAKVEWAGKKFNFPLQRPVLLNRGTRVRFGPAGSSGTRGYLAVAGGIQVERLLGSQSTMLRAGWGGWQGRALRSEDELPCGRESQFNLKVKERLGRLGDQPFRSVPWFFRPLPLIDDGVVALRLIRGRHFTELDSASQRAFFGEFQITPESDRMGIRLSGPALCFRRSLGELNSSGMVRGTLQLPQGADQSLLLMADGPPTGGYPQLAHVIAADWALAGQLAPGSRLRFVEVELKEAHEAFRKQEQGMKQISETFQQWVRAEQ